MVEVAVTPVRVPRAGDLLVATPRLVDPNFDRTVVFVIEHQREGSMGVVINRASNVECASALPRWASRLGAASHLGLGGPVEPQGLLALAATTGGVGLVDLTTDPDELDRSVQSVRLFGGHAGWGPGQLRAELKSGAWWVFESMPGDLTSDADTLWHDVLARQPPPACLLAQYPADPSVN